MLKTELLCKRHDRKGFDCGQEELNTYLKKMASQHIRKDISKTFVLFDDEDKSEKVKILGFYTLSIYNCETSDLPYEIAKKFPDKMPGLLLGRLAISLANQKKKLGTFLMLDALKKTLETSNNVGVFALFVDAKNDAAKTFYEKFGFLSFPEYRLKMFLSLKKIKGLLVS